MSSRLIYSMEQAWFLYNAICIKTYYLVYVIIWKYIISIIYILQGCLFATTSVIPIIRHFPIDDLIFRPEVTYRENLLSQRFRADRNRQMARGSPHGARIAGDPPSCKSRTTRLAQFFFFKIIAHAVSSNEYDRTPVRCGNYASASRRAGNRAKPNRTIYVSPNISYSL